MNNERSKPFREAMNELILIRIPAEEKRLLRAIAHTRGLTLSDFMRRAAAQAARKELM